MGTSMLANRLTSATVNAITPGSSGGSSSGLVGGGAAVSVSWRMVAAVTAHAARATAQLLPLSRAFDTGLRPGPFPDQAASLLPGLLAATRTGLPPASDGGLTNEVNLLHSQPPLCWAHEITSVLPRSYGGSMPPAPPLTTVAALGPA